MKNKYMDKLFRMGCLKLTKEEIIENNQWNKRVKKLESLISIGNKG